MLCIQALSRAALCDGPTYPCSLRECCAHDPFKSGRPSPCWLHRLRTGSILRELVRPRSGVHHRTSYDGHVVAGADCRGGIVTPSSDEPSAQAQAIMERVLG